MAKQPNKSPIRIENVTFDTPVEQIPEVWNAEADFFSDVLMDAPGVEDALNRLINKHVALALKEYFEDGMIQINSFDKNDPVTITFYSEQVEKRENLKDVVSNHIDLDFFDSDDHHEVDRVIECFKECVSLLEAHKVKKEAKQNEGSHLRKSKHKGKGAGSRKSAPATA
ncbi:MAG TPA: hypothetical protein VE977_13855 [Pyrinomonadaceae bacterium]|nr:hypothetical protein [Pyrinomonadaceae bacterium]